MRQWKLACPVHNLDELRDTIANDLCVDAAIFDLRRSLGVEPGASLRPLIMALSPYKGLITSAHLCNEFDVITPAGCSLLEQDIELLATLGIPVGVLHLRAPTSGTHVQEQLGYIQSVRSAYNVAVAIENLPDSRNRSRGYRWVQDPATIASQLTDERWLGLGVCLDTSHAICCGCTRWDIPAIYERTLVIHLSGSLPGQDLHLSIGPSTDASLLAMVADIIAHAVNDGVVIAEQLNYGDSLASARYLRNCGWGCH